MTLKYTLKRKAVMDGDEEIATVRGLSLNDIVELVTLNKDAMESVFEQFNGRDPSTITEDEVTSTGLGMLTSAPMLIAQIIAVGADAYKNYTPDTDENPVEVVLGMPTGLQIAFLEAIGTMTFNAANPPKKMLALALKMAQGVSQSDRPA